jgi:cytoskeletal protein CcmA (bactofilin family)
MAREESSKSSAMNSIIGAGSTFNGTLRTEGGLRGDVSATQAILGGTVIGTVRAERQLELQSGSRVEGDIFTRSLIMEEGVFFEGNCRMRPEGERECGKC